ncbi:MAG TPA: energy transducer TonB [Rhizomicrobium sp.]|nr:energy transducer TonB [Rhizomicrobium sp.]
MTPERVIGIGFVGLLHVVAISAIIYGLQQHYATVQPEVPFTVVPTKPEHPPQVVKPTLPKVDLSNQRVDVPPPRWVTQDDTPRIPADTQSRQPPHDLVASIPDTATMGIMGTHSSPPYPLLDRRLGHEGTVTLRMTVSPEGTVVDAQVVKSSGYPGLDEAAVSWVVAHWRYHAATHAGAGISSQTTAAVMFSLRTSG